MKRSSLRDPILTILLFFALALAGETCGQGGDLLRELREKAKPGAAHRRLDACVGKWKIRVEYRLRPDLNPESSIGTAEFRWILGDRFLEQTVDGKGVAGNYEGRGLIGHDNVLGSYAGTWVDTMNSGVTHLNGNVEGDGRTFRFRSTATDPLEGKAKTHEVLFRILSQDELQYLVIAKHPATGEDVILLNISYRRVK